MGLHRKQQQRGQRRNGRSSTTTRGAATAFSMAVVWSLILTTTTTTTTTSRTTNALSVPRQSPARRRPPPTSTRTRSLGAIFDSGLVGQSHSHHCHSDCRGYDEQQPHGRTDSTATFVPSVYYPSSPDSPSSGGGGRGDLPDENNSNNNGLPNSSTPPSSVSLNRLLQQQGRWLTVITSFFQQQTGGPPPEVEDMSVLLYDVFLLLNLTASISFWVIHRMDVSFLSAALSEGCLLSLLWIAAGLYSGAFLYSAVDGHRPNGGPTAASLLAVNTFVNTVNLRLLFALIAAMVDHRPVGIGLGEDLLSLELGFGLVLMTVWRALHSRFVPRL